MSTTMLLERNVARPVRRGEGEEAGPAARCAQVIGLRYVTDEGPGIRRDCGDGDCRYTLPDGLPLDDPEELRRIRALAIPPAYQDVWICPLPDGHLQATGRDARGRKQYRYHPRWREVRDETKFHRMLAFASALPLIRARVEHDLALPGLPRDKVLALVVRLLETTLIRVGNEEYVRENGSFGLTTLRSEHVEVIGTALRFHFRGKSGKEHTIDVRDRRLARIVKRCQDLPGHELFQYVDHEGHLHAIGSAEVNDYLHRIAPGGFTAKDFRTWAGTILCALALRDLGPAPTQSAAKRSIVSAVKAVAERLGNTPAVCRKCYIHPAIPEAYAEGTLAGALSSMTDEDGELHPDEAAVIALLRRLQGDTVPPCAW